MGKSSKGDRIITLETALKDIRATAMQHPFFIEEAFRTKDASALSGDEFDWTWIAIVADEALNDSG